MVANFDMINRIAEQQFLRDFFIQGVGGRKTLVLHSPSGVGKSFLVDHVVSNLQIDTPYVKMGRGTNFDGPTYIQQIACALDQLAKSNGYFETLNQFVEVLGSEDKSLVGKFSGAAEKAIGKIAVGGVPVISDILASMASEKSPVDQILYGSSADALQMSEKYVRHVMTKNKLILRINRYGDIDELSDLYLKNIIANCQSIILVLEVTTESNEISHSEFVLNFESQFLEQNTEYRKIDVVNIKHIVDSYVRSSKLSLSNSEVRDLIRKAYSTSDGNFRKLNLLISDTANNSSTDQNLSYEDKLKLMVETMSTECKLLLGLAIVAPSYLDLNGVESIWASSPHTSNFDLHSTVNTLTGNYDGLIKLDEKRISVSDPLLKSYLVDATVLDREIIIARALLLQQFNEDNKRTNSSDTYYFNLISIIALIIQGGGSGDSSLLISNLKKLDLGRYPTNKGNLAKSMNHLFDNYIFKVRKTAEEISTIRQLNLSYEETIKILYRLGYIDDVDRIYGLYSQFLPIEEHSDCLRLTIISAQVLGGKKASIDELEKIDRSNEILYYGSRLLLILYHRVFDNTRKAKQTWKRLLKKSDIEKTDFRGVFFEYGALTHPVNMVKKIRILKKAEKIHTANKNEFHAASCKLGIASTYLYSPFAKAWKLRMAEENYSSGSGVFSEVRLMDHIVENHRSIAEIHQGNPNAKTLESLISAYNKCALIPDKLLIGANIVNCFLMNRERNKDVPNIGPYVHDILRYGRIYRNRNSEYFRYSAAACYRYFVFLDDEKMIREIAQNDLSFMSMNFLFMNVGSPKNFLSRFLTRNVVSKIYLAFWPKTLPVYNWSIDFYSIDMSLKSEGE